MVKKLQGVNRYLYVATFSLINRFDVVSNMIAVSLVPWVTTKTFAFMIEIPLNRFAHVTGQVRFHLKNVFINMQQYPQFNDSISELIEVLSKSKAIEIQVDAASNAILQSLKRGNKLLTCGNGGSAADALHLAEELVGKYNRERRGLPAICFNADVTAITCIANDYGYDRIFDRQVEALGKPGDVLVGFTTSGNSPNVLAAFKRAKLSGITTIYLGGKDGGAAKGLCDHEIIIPSYTTARIQEVHTLILHQWLEAIDMVDWDHIEI